MIELPLFPLKTVLYPGGPLPLRIFEPRYLSMISRCLKRGEGFGVILIREGSEVGEAETFDVGTIAEIADWYQGNDGLLGVTATGTERFRIGTIGQQPDGLYTAEIELLEREPSARLPERYQPLKAVLQEILEELSSHYSDVAKEYDDASWVGYRLAELLPLPMPTKQIMLEMIDPNQRLALLRPHVEGVSARPS